MRANITGDSKVRGGSQLRICVALSGLLCNWLYCPRPALRFAWTEKCRPVGAEKSSGGFRHTPRMSYDAVERMVAAEISEVAICSWETWVMNSGTGRPSSGMSRRPLRPRDGPVGA